MSALHLPTGRNKYCGPTSLSAISGLDKDTCARALRSRSGRRAILGAYNSELRDGLRLLGFQWKEQSFQKEQRLPLGQWLATLSKAQRSARAIIQVKGHYLAMSKQRFADSMTNSGRELLNWEQLSPRCLRKPVEVVFWIEGPARAELPNMFREEDAKRYQRWLAGQRTRIAAVKLAASLGLRLEKERGRDGLIWLEVADESVLMPRLLAAGVACEGEHLPSLISEHESCSYIDWEDALSTLQNIQRRWAP